MRMALWVRKAPRACGAPTPVRHEHPFHAGFYWKSPGCRSLLGVAEPIEKLEQPIEKLELIVAVHEAFSAANIPGAAEGFDATGPTAVARAAEAELEIHQDADRSHRDAAAGSRQYPTV
jgi:hypothetical protein